MPCLPVKFVFSPSAGDRICSCCSNPTLLFPTVQFYKEPARCCLEEIRETWNTRHSFRQALLRGPIRLHGIQSSTPWSSQVESFKMKGIDLRLDVLLKKWTGILITVLLIVALGIVSLFIAPYNMTRITLLYDIMSYYDLFPFIRKNASNHHSFRDHE